MPDIIIQVPRTQYPSLQINDIGYYAIMQDDLIGGFNLNNPAANNDTGLVQIGPITAIDETTSLSDGTLTTSITMTIDEFTEEPTEFTYIFFSKNDRQVLPDGTLMDSAQLNMTSPLGYYAQARFSCNDSSKAEIYSASCEIAESSK
jgi:hypothetical protein